MSTPFLSITSTTHHGNMSYKWGSSESVLKNRTSFLEEQGIELNTCVAMKTQDLDQVVIVDERDKNKGMLDMETAIMADALITTDKNLFLFLLTADCLPISFYDPQQNVIALAHLSWKTTDLQLVTKVMGILVTNFKSMPENIVINVGPHISHQSYVLPTIAQVNDKEWRSFITEQPLGGYCIDLVGYNKQQLIECGVFESHISISKEDTARSQDYFSHYRSMRTGEPEGRLATVIGLIDTEFSHAQ